MYTKPLIHKVELGSYQQYHGTDYYLLDASLLRVGDAAESDEYVCITLRRTVHGQNEWWLLIKQFGEFDVFEEVLGDAQETMLSLMHNLMVRGAT